MLSAKLNMQTLKVLTVAAGIAAGPEGGHLICEYEDAAELLRR